MSNSETIPANDGKGGSYVYGGVVHVNDIQLTFGEWLQGNTNDPNDMLKKSIQKMAQWQSYSWLRKPNIMIVARHPHWGNGFICWGALTSEERNKRYLETRAKGSFNKAVQYPEIQMYILRNATSKDFPATPLNAQITNNTFKIGSYTNYEDNFRNGTYIFSASSTQKSFGSVNIQPCFAFNDNNRSQKAWFCNGVAKSAFPQYNVGFSDGYTQAPYDEKGFYQGGGGCGNSWTTIGLGKASHPGEWVQIQMPFALNINRFKLISNVRRFVLFGSNDGKFWMNMGERTTTGPLNDMNEEFLVTSNDLFKYFRFVFKEIHTNMPNPAGTTFSAFKNIRGVGVFHCSLIGSQVLPKDREGFQNIGAVYEGLDNIYSQETKLLTDLTDFGRKYTEYIDCSMANCSTYSQKKSDMEKAYSLIIDKDIPNVNKSMPSGGLTPSQYDASFNSLVAAHNNVLKLRNELDVKMKELNQEEHTKYSDFKGNFDSAMYTNILVTVLATTMIYFTFTKM